jgi:NADPH:quinone reductase
MRSALIDEIGAAPRLADIDRPKRQAGMTLVRTLAAPLNPIDFAVAAGIFYGGHPPLPYVPGNEVVGEVVESDGWPSGKRVWAGGGGLGTAGAGCLAEFAVVPDDRVEPVPDGLNPSLAGALGQAGLTGWLAATWRGRVGATDSVLVLGATGAVGLVAIQAARLAGATRIVAVGRDASALQRAQDLGASAVVVLDADHASDHAASRLAERLVDAGGPPTLVIDPLWGVPGLAAIQAAASGARIVQLGQSAGASAPVTSAAIRGKQLDILGFSILAVPPDVRGPGYAALTHAALAEQLTLPIASYPLAEIADAWEAAQRPQRDKVVVTL